MTNNNIPDFAKPKVETLRMRSDPIFGKLLLAIRNVRESDFTIYEPGHAQKLKSEIISKPRQELHTLISEFLDNAKEGKQNIKSRINSHTESKVDPDPSTQIINSLRQQEIRSLLRSKTLEQRKGMVENELKSGNSEILIAISSSPDELMPTKTLKKYREDFAYSQDPDLENYKHQVDELEKIVRQQCGRLNSDHTQILLENKLDDPLTMKDHFETFPPQDDNAKRLSNAMLNREQSNLRIQQNRNEFESNNTGMKL